MYKIKVKQYMTKKATPEFDFMLKWNNDNPMPMRVMIGEKLEETRGMVKMQLHADITEKITPTCMKCGRAITNKVSQYFGMGPECGGHNYVSPFSTDEELAKAVEEYREQLRHITWTGWIIKSAIEEEINLSGNKVLTNEFEKNSQKDDVKRKKITIRIDKSKNVFTEDALYISFPYDNNIISIIRALPTRFWSKDKEWEVPSDKLDYLKREFSNYEIEIKGKVSNKKSVAQIPVGFEFKTTPFEHQVDGFNYGLQNDRWLLGDEQGLGKTKQVIDIAIAKKLQKNYTHCLIVCGVNGLKWNWQREIETHSNENGYILGQRVLKNGKLKIGSSKDKLEDLYNVSKLPYFLITNVESLRDDEIAGEIAKLCKSKEIGLVAIDEVHKCKNPSSQQGKGILKVQPECRIAMTGTPLMNTPLDLFIIMKWLGYEKHSFYAFKNHHCIMGGFGGYEVVGYKNLNELQDNLNSIMLRRLKDDVLDLPEKLFIDEYVDMTPKQSIIYKEVSASIKSNIDMIKCAPDPLAQLIRLRQATGYTGILSSEIQESAKLDRMEELVDEIVENGKKVVIFSNWTQITDIAYARLSKKYKGILITGDTKDNERQSLVKKYQEDANTVFAMGTIGAMGTGLTLTAGTVEIFLDEPWTMAAKDQAIDRCHRIGTTENITIYTLMAHDTIDERIHELVKRKGAISDALVDGKTNESKTEIIDYLLG